MTTTYSHDELIARLRERAADPIRRIEIRPPVTATGTDVVLPPPATADQVAAAEKAVGVKFPTLLGRLFTEVANGGFGPGPGLVGVRAGAADPGGKSVEALHARMLAFAAQNPAWQWSPIIVPISDHSGVFVCVDCSTEAARVVEFDFQELDGNDEDGGWSDAFSERSGSLHAWLEEWLDGVA